MSASQRQRLKDLFESRKNEWIPLPVILSMHIAQYGTRIKELRDEDGMNIENKWQSINGERHSWFRYVPQEAYKKVEFKEAEHGQMAFV